MDAAGSIVAVASLFSADEAEASGSLNTLDPLAKADMKSAPALVGDAKGLSGRLCSKLHSIMRKTIFNTAKTGEPKLEGMLKNS